MTYQESLDISTHGRGTVNISRQVADAITRSGIQTGICHVFVQHTSASLILCENADPQVRADLERFMVEIVPDGYHLFRHTAEGPDDMPAHVRSILTNMDLTIPVSHGRPALGIWQGIYLYEHRTHAHRRTVTVTVTG
ncbi:secondary thiamine-phosphate synthase enzyme YjbQ [Thiolapillus sp.]